MGPIASYGYMSRNVDERPDMAYGRTTSAEQSTELPCHLNTITVTLRTNAPLIFKCAAALQTLHPQPSTLNPQP